MIRELGAARYLRQVFIIVTYQTCGSHVTAVEALEIENMREHNPSSSTEKITRNSSKL
eukprot:SAG31_NODE_217_length_19988_cov_53.300820_17_plen_58_part_00